MTTTPPLAEHVAERRLACLATLIHEHELIRKALAVLDTVAARLATDAAVQPASIGRLIHFLHLFGDSCHHAKEEGILFVALEAAGIKKAGGPLGAMLADHERGRELVRTMADALSRLEREGQRARFVLAARQYTSLLSQHIAKENDVLFPMASKVLKPEQDAELTAAFAKHEELAVGPGGHERLHQDLDALAHEFLNSGRY